MLTAQQCLLPGPVGTCLGSEQVDYAADLRAAGTPEEYIRWRLAMLGGIRRGDDAYLSGGVERLLGRPATGFTTWAHREATGAP